MSEDKNKDVKFKIDKWVYHATGRNTCEACYKNDGKEFKTLEEAPTIPVHPNCNCWLEPIPAKDKNYNLSNFGKEFIRKYEGTKEYQSSKKVNSYRNNKFYPYKDIDGNWTIGYGHLILAGENFDSGIDDDTAENLFAKDLDKETAYANGVITNPDLTQKQFDTFLSLGYNLKKSSLSNSITLELINKGKKKKVENP
jgi:GH24 family phage-related lysozyme (muramidase)